MQKLSDAKQYHRIKYRLFFTESAVMIMVLAGLFFGGISFYIKDAMSAVTHQYYAVVFLYLAVMSVIFYCIGLPFSFYEEYLLEHRFGLSRQSLAAWGKDHGKKTAISFLVFMATGGAVYFFLRHFPAGWWLLAGFLWIMVSIVLARLVPSVIIPLFYRYVPLEDTELTQKIIALCRRCGVIISSVFVINFSAKTKKANAFVCGLGSNRRIVLADTLIEEFSDEEIEQVVAHELGHYVHHDMAKLILVNSSVAFAAFFVADRVLQEAASSFGLSGIADIALFPLLCLCMGVLLFIVLPAQNYFSRHLETQADGFCLRQAGPPQAFISLMTKLGRINLADGNPSRWVEFLFYDHPPLAQRIQFAETLEVKQ